MTAEIIKQWTVGELTFTATLRPDEVSAIHDDINYGHISGWLPDDLTLGNDQWIVHYDGGHVLIYTTNNDADKKAEEEELERVRAYFRDEWHYCFVAVTISFRGWDIAKDSIGGLVSNEEFGSHIEECASEAEAEARAFLEAAASAAVALRIREAAQ